jgi:tRNA threonylcarbamoyladenosine biosynthesis protein TsaB
MDTRQDKDPGARSGGSAPGWLLAFDTSTERLAVALDGPGGGWFVEAAGGAEASRSLLPQSQALLRQAGLDWAELSAVAFGRGPGAFTGLRTSCAVAQGLACGLGCVVLPVDSLLIVAEDARQAAGERGPFDIGVVMDARMGEAYAARYRFTPGAAGDITAAGWQASEPPCLCDPGPLRERWALHPPQCIAGSGLLAFGSLPWASLGSALQEQEVSRARALARLARSAFDAGAGLDPALALPIYLRDKVALTTAERAQRAAATAVQGGPA